MVDSNPTYFPKTLRIRNEIIDLGPQDVKELYNSKNLKELINRTFTDEYFRYIKDEQYFPGCPFSIYQKHYRDRLEKYLLLRPDADEFSFLENEDAIISRILNMSEQDKNHYYSFYSGLYDDPHKVNFKLSAEKTGNFIYSRIYDLGHFYIVPGYSIWENNTSPTLWEQPRKVKIPARNPQAEEKLGASPLDDPIEDQTSVITPAVSSQKIEKKSSLNLNDLFKDHSQFEEVVRKLTANSVLIGEGNFFRLSAIQLEENGLSEIRAICALGYLLKIKHYFNQGTQDISIAKALSNFFNVPISKSAYNRAKDQCLSFGSDKAEDYFKLYFSI